MTGEIDSIPDFDSNGNLPPGEYKVTMDDIENKLTWSPTRKKLFGGLTQAILVLKDAGVKRVYIDGSFTTQKDDPEDIDGCWELNDNIDADKLDPVFLDREHPREIMKQKYGIDFLIAGVDQGQNQGQPIEDFFQLSRDNDPKGVLVLEF